MAALFPTPMLDMRHLNAAACNSSTTVDERLQALEVRQSAHAELSHVVEEACVVVDVGVTCDTRCIVVQLVLV
jgi:hypothetical protein